MTLTLPKLSESQRRCLIGTRLGNLYFYPQISVRRLEAGESIGWFSMRASSLNTKEARAVCPDRANCTVPALTLHRHGLLNLPESGGTVPLSPWGREVASALATSEEAAAIRIEDTHIRRREDQDAHFRREETWKKEHEVERQKAHELANQGYGQDRTQVSRLTELAMKIGAGANNVDELLAEIKAAYRARQAAITMREEAGRQLDELDARMKRETARRR